MAGAIAYVMDFDDFVKITEGSQRFFCIRTKEMVREVALHLICTARKGDTVFVYEEIAIVDSAKEYEERIKHFKTKVKQRMPDAAMGFVAFNVKQLVDALNFGESVASPF